MRSWLALLACWLALGPAANAATSAATYSWPVLGAIDGDTIKVRMPGLPNELQPVKVRVTGIDTPETGGRAKCQAERDLAAKASALTRFLVNDARARKLPVVFSEIGWDKYGGRINAEVTIDNRSLGATLIKAGLARPYDGGKRKSWC